MPRFAGVPVEQEPKKPRFGGVPVAEMAAPAATPAEPSVMDRVMQGADVAGGLAYQGGIGVNRGILNMLGLPGTLLDLLPPGATPFSNMPNGEELQQMFRLDRAPEPRNPGETITGRIGEEIGSMLIPELGVAQKAVQMGLPAVRQAGGLVRYFLEPAAVNPVKNIAKEIGVATAAGTGAGMANTMVDRDTTGGQIADMFGAIGGAGALGLIDTIGRGAGNIFNAARQNPNYIDETVKDAVVDRIGKAAGLDANGTPMDTQTLVDAINAPTTQRPSEVIPGFEESLADRTGNPGLASMEYGRQSGPNAGDFARRRSANSEAVDAAMRGVEPTETPGAFRSALEDTRNQRVGDAAAATGAAQSEFDRYIQNLRPTMGGEERGAAVRGGVQNAERIGRDMEHAVWEGTDAAVDPAPLADALDAARGGLPLARQDSIADLNPTVDIPRRLMGDAEEGVPVQVPVAELNAMRSTLLKEQRDALSAGDRNRAEAAGRMIDEVNGYLDSDALPTDVRAATASAREVSRSVNERFNRPNDPLAATLAEREGRPNLPDSAVARQFVQPDAKQASNIDRLLAETDLTSHGGSVRAAVKDEILAQMEKGSVLGDPEAIDQFLGSYGRVFERFPDLRDELTQAAAAGRNLDAARVAQDDLTASVGSPDGSVKGKGPVGKYLQYTDATSERAINEVLNAKDPEAAAAELMDFVGPNPKAAEGARAAFWQKLKSESTSADNAQRSAGGKYQWRGDWLKRFIETPSTAAVAKVLYRDNPEALATIQKYADVLDNVDLRQRGRAPGTSGTAQGVNPVLTPETLQSRFYAYMRGQVSGTYLATSIAAVVARRWVRNAQTAALDRLTDQVLLNPEMAADLLKKNNPANRAALARKAKMWLGNEANTLLQLLDDAQDDGEEKPDGL